jgi:HAD superfamily phosphoserine phosphatase-like hydrolase
MSVNKKVKIYAFDFDGTLTRRDSLIEFIRFARGNLTFAYGIVLFFPLLLLMKLGLYDNGKCKERMFHFFFHDMSIDYFNDLCEHFAERRSHIIRAKGMQRVKQAVHEGCPVLIVSASVDNWVKPFFENAGLTVTGMSPQVRIVGTRLELRGSWLTGHFATPNCYGAEKVHRITEIYPYRKDYTLVAFGDSRGDKEMLDYADEKYYKPFK